jgi:amino acid transporter
MPPADGNSLPRPLFAGAAIASIGGPLALVAFYLPGAAGGAIGASGLTAAIAIVVFLAPLAVWLGYSERVASAGGLAAFVEAAAGPVAARVQALVWTVSYFLYLPYTVTFIVYDVLPEIFPGIVPYRASLELAIPAGIAVLVLAPRFVAFSALALAAVAQLVLAVVLGAVMLSHAGAHAATFTSTAGTRTMAKGGAGVSLLFVCASLPLFFAGEVREGARSVRRGLVLAYACAAAVMLLVAVPLASVPRAIRGADLPGLAIAQAYSGRGLAIAIGLGGAVSVAGLIVLEFLALGRLLHWLFRMPVRLASAGVAVPFVAADAISLVNPGRFYDDLLRPSLIALWISQIIVFAVYPLFRLRLRPHLVAPATALAAVACALSGWGLYLAVSSNLGT